MRKIRGIVLAGGWENDYTKGRLYEFARKGGYEPNCNEKDSRVCVEYVNILINGGVTYVRIGVHRGFKYVKS